jgi:aspartate/glutamate racemase
MKMSSSGTDTYGTPLIAVFDHLATELLPGVAVKHILDEPLLELVRRRGGLDGSDAGRLQTHVAEAEAIGARAVLVTCSTVSPLVDRVRQATSLPVFKIDEAMLEAAVQLGPRIGVLATNPTTLKPTCHLLRERASAPEWIDIDPTVPRSGRAFGRRWRHA